MYQNIYVQCFFKTMKLVISIDVQGFTTDMNAFVVKELAAYDGTQIYHSIFSETFPITDLLPNLQYRAKWLTTNHHGLDWNTGFTLYAALYAILRNITASREIYVKGWEKAKIVRQYTDQPLMKILENPKLEKSNPQGLTTCMCSLTFVKTLYNNF